MVSSGRPPLLLTNHRGGGIGDFGLNLKAHLESVLGSLETEETSIDGRGSLRQSSRAATYPGPVIANLGLTAWGRSGPRNFLGFGSVGLHRSLGFPTTVMVHHAIEIFDIQETGYAVSPLVLAGAHWALAQVRHCRLVVFSPRIRDLLTEGYGARTVTLLPIPGERTRNLAGPRAGGRPKIVHAGYWAPYKGIDLFIALGEEMRGRAECLLVGRPHSGLMRDGSFRQQAEVWTLRSQAAGIRVTGFLTPAELDAEFSGPTVGVLPYTSVSGASASFQMFAERGVPVVASDLPEFRYLRDAGAGVLLVPPTREGLSSGVRRLLDEPPLWSDLARRQAEFNERYSWDHFVSVLLAH